MTEESKRVETPREEGAWLEPPLRGIPPKFPLELAW